MGWPPPPPLYTSSTTLKASFWTQSGNKVTAYGQETSYSYINITIYAHMHAIKLGF